MSSEHKFGGVWTGIKLEVLKNYLHFYTTALKGKFSNLLYIDAFAGTGICTVKGTDGPTDIDGSAMIALSVQPQFTQCHFIDDNPAHVRALEELKKQYPDRLIEVHLGDANQKLEEILKKIDWRSSRAVLFLDPYGMEVAWETLERISATAAIDVWFLFPLAGIYRNAPRDYRALDATKERALTRCFGNEDWKTAFYDQAPQGDLFGEEQTIRIADVRDLLQYTRQRLQELFPAVLEPMILPKSGAPMFALYFLIANPNPAAIGLSTKVASHILSKPG